MVRTLDCVSFFDTQIDVVTDARLGIGGDGNVVDVMNAPLERSLSLPRRDLHAVLGILGVTAFGILCLWFPAVVLRVPMPSDMLASSATTAIWQTVALVFFPFWWAVSRLGMRISELGVTREQIGSSTALGCALYTLALAAFIYCSGGLMMQGHAVRQADPLDAAMLVGTMSVIAAGTDLTTRGFVLLTLARHSHVVFAIFMQNLVWFVGHVHEITMLVDCLGAPGAIGLTLTLGIVGDMIVLKTRNVLGLAIAHVLLNVVLGMYLRQL